jgi:AraC-like DNA-binding protein
MDFAIYVGDFDVDPETNRVLDVALEMTRGASLSEIALDCQFSCQSSFTRAFRRATGMTPDEYRRTLQ